MPTSNDDAPGLSGSDERMTTLCWFPFYPADWLASLCVRGMTNAQKGLYIELLCHQWNEGGAIASDDITVSRACGCSIDDPDMVAVLLKFPKQDNGTRANKRLSELWAKQSEKHSNRVQSGSIKKNHNHNQNQIAEAMLQQCSEVLKNNKDFTELLTEWLNSRWEKKAPVTLRGAKMTMKKLCECSPAIAIEALRKSVENDWQGVFPESVNSGKPSFGQKPARPQSPEWSPH